MHPYVDIHTHNTTEATGVYAIVNVFANSLITNSVNHRISAGLHPWHINDKHPDFLKNLEAATSQPQLVAIGEAGIDKTLQISYDLQKEVFLQQAHIAAKKKLPMIIHAVRTYYDFISLRKQFQTAPPWIIHGFNGNIQQAEALIKSGFFLSFGEAIIRKEQLKTTLKKLPLKHLFFETDNEAIPIEEIYKVASTTREEPLEVLKAEIFSNFAALFSINTNDN